MEEKKRAMSAAQAKRRRMRREKLRRRRRRIILFRLAFLVTFIILLFIGGKFLFKTFTSKSDAGDYIPESKVDVETVEPVADDEVGDRLLALSKDNSAYKEIYEHKEEYPETVLKAVINNPEMLDYAKGYLHQGDAPAAKLTAKEKAQKIPLLQQWDPRWGYIPYGEDNIGLSGCAPTCLSMVIIGLTQNYQATPDAVGNYAMAYNYYQDGVGTAWTIMTDGCQNFGVQGTEIGLDKDAIDAHLEKGEPIICSVRPGIFTTSGHFIVITEKKKDGYMVNDPNSIKRSHILWNYETLSGEIKNLWAFSKK